MADSLQQKDVVARVVQWHNRHWLARRIRASDVNSIGVVVMPWAPGTGAPETAATAAGWKVWPSRIRHILLAQVAKLRRGKKSPAAESSGAADGQSAEHGTEDSAAAAAALVPAFTEEFAPGLTHEQIVPFARKHGLEDSPAPDDWPRRQISPQSDVVEVWLYLLTAGITVEHHRPRLLLGARPGDPILGRRVLSPVRVAAAVLGPLLLASLIGLGVWWGSASGSKDHAKAAHAGAAASAASGAAASSPGHRASEKDATPVAHAGSAPEGHMASAPEQASSASAHTIPAAASAASGPTESAVSRVETAASGDHATAASAPAHVTDKVPPKVGSPPETPRLGRITLPAKPEPEKPTDGQGLQPILKDTPAPAADAGQHFALMSRGPRSRAAAQEMVPRMEAAARTVDKTELPPDARIEVMETRGSWHAVWWPFPDRQSATQARWALALKGITVDLVAF